MSQTNFLIGRGELLTNEIKGPKRMPGKAEVYSFQIAQQRLTPQFTSVAKALDGLPPDACPGDFGVARLTMNPSYIARSFFPVACAAALRPCPTAMTACVWSGCSRLPSAR